MVQFCCNPTNTRRLVFIIFEGDDKDGLGFATSFFNFFLCILEKSLKDGL